MAKKQNSEREIEIDGYRLGRRGDVYVADNRTLSGGKRSGKRTTLGEFASEAAAAAALRTFVDGRNTLLRQQGQLSIGDLWTKWLAYRAKNGFSNDIYDANWASLKPAFAHIAAVSLTEDDCMNYARGRFALKRSPWTVCTELSRLRACLAWAVKRRLIEFAPIVWVPQRGKPKDTVISPEEARALLIAAEDDMHVYSFIVLALTTAARHTAILELEWSRIDFDRGLINYEVDIVRDPMSKSWKKGRAEVAMNALARSTLMKAREAAQTDYVIEYRSKPLKSIRASFALAVGRAGLGEVIPAPTKTKPNRVRVETDITPHTIRHSVNTWLQEMGVDAEKRAKLLGHSDVHTNTLNYSHGSATKMLGMVVEIINNELDVGRITSPGRNTLIDQPPSGLEPA